MVAAAAARLIGHAPVTPMEAFLHQSSLLAQAGLRQQVATLTEQLAQQQQGDRAGSGGVAPALD